MNDRLIKDYRPYFAKLCDLSYDKEHGISLINDNDLGHRMYNQTSFVKKYVERRICPAMAT